MTSGSRSCGLASATPPGAIPPHSGEEPRTLRVMLELGELGELRLFSSHVALQRIQVVYDTTPFLVRKTPAHIVAAHIPLRSE